MNLRIDQIGNCEKGEVVLAMRGNANGAQGWGLICEAAVRDDVFSCILWLGVHEGIPPEVHVNYSEQTPLLRTGKKLQVRPGLEAFSLVRQFPNTDDPSGPHLIAVGGLFGFFCRENVIHKQLPTHDNVLVTLDGNVIHFRDFPDDCRLLGLIQSWEPELADEAGVTLKA